MRKGSKLRARTPIFNTMLLGISISLYIAGCSSPKPAQQEQGPHRYSLTGRVVSVEKAKNRVVVDAGDIPGFMMAMTMGYDVKDPSLLDSLSSEDQIKADVVVNQNDVWLENIVVVKKGDPAKASSSSESHPSSTPTGKQ
jgi:Cu/Ag efflux protein CusF